MEGFLCFFWIWSPLDFFLTGGEGPSIGCRVSPPPKTSMWVVSLPRQGRYLDCLHPIMLIYTVNCQPWPETLGMVSTSVLPFWSRTDRQDSRANPAITGSMCLDSAILSILSFYLTCLSVDCRFRMYAFCSLFSGFPGFLHPLNLFFRWNYSLLISVAFK